MTHATQSTRQSSHATIHNITQEPTALLDDQPTGNTTLENTEQQSPTTDELTPGELLYKPEAPTEVYEVISTYEDDYGNIKTRVRVHSDTDHLDERTHSYFENQLEREFAYVSPPGEEPTTDTTTTESTTDDSTSWETPESHGQATLGTPANSDDAVAKSTTTNNKSKTDDSTETEQATLFN